MNSLNSSPIVTSMPEVQYDDSGWETDSRCSELREPLVTGTMALDASRTRLVKVIKRFREETCREHFVENARRHSDATAAIRYPTTFVRRTDSFEVSRIVPSKLVYDSSVAKHSLLFWEPVDSSPEVEFSALPLYRTPFIDAYTVSHNQHGTEIAFTFIEAASEAKTQEVWMNYDPSIVRSRRTDLSSKVI